MRCKYKSVWSTVLAGHRRGVKWQGQRSGSCHIWGHPHAIQYRKVPGAAIGMATLLSNTEPGVDCNESVQERSHRHLCIWCVSPFLQFKQCPISCTGPSLNQYISQFINFWDISQWVLLGQRNKKTTGNTNTGLWWRRNPFITSCCKGEASVTDKPRGHASGTAVVTWFHWAPTNISKATGIFLLIFTVVK